MLEEGCEMIVHQVRKSGIILLAALLCCSPIGAANKVITKKFNWQISSSDHFDIYHYESAGQTLLPLVFTYAEDAFRRVTHFLPDNPSAKYPLFVYNTHNDFEQSNIVAISEGIGGVTEVFKDRLVVGNTGSQRFLRYVVCHEFTHEVEFDYLFGGFWRSLSIIKFLIYPNWMMEGLAEYSTGDLEATTREMYLRDAATSGRLLPLGHLENFNHLLPHQVTLAYKESEACIRFIADEYGEETLPSLLRLYKKYFDSTTVLHEAAGTDLTTLDKKFREHLEDIYSRAVHGREEPVAYGRPLTRPGMYPRFNESAIFSPNGRSVAYIADDRGIKEIYLYDLATGATERLWSLTRSITVENIHTDGRGLCFSRDGNYLVFAVEKEQRDCIALFDVRSRRLVLHYPSVTSVDSPVFSADGSLVYFSGIRGGFRDIYEYRLATGETTPLTGDAGDDIDACLSPDGKSLIVSSERDNGSGRLHYNLCRVDLGLKTKHYITGAPCDERYPAFLPDGSIVYTADPDGVFDLYALAPGSAAPRLLTAVIGGNFQPQASPDGKNLLFSSFRAGEKHLYLADLSMMLSHSSVESYPPLTKGDKGGFDVGKQSGQPPPPSKPYTCRASTDLIFPLLFYTSVDGWYFAGYWQASDMLGNHQVQAVATHISGLQYTDYRVNYGFLAYRPQVYISASGTDDFRDVDRTIKRQRYAQTVTVLYPLNRFQSAGLFIETIDRRERAVTGPAPEMRTRENSVGVTATHDTTTGAYLETTAGLRAAAAAKVSDIFMGGDYRYQSVSGETNTFIPLGKEHTLLWRVVGNGSYGADAETFSLGGIDRLRGISSSDIMAKKVLVNTLEWRFPLAYNLNYDMYYIFPGLFFKSLYGGLFVDTGFSFNEDNQFSRLSGDDWKTGAGLSLRCYTFVLQQYPLLLTLQYALPLDQNDGVTYFAVTTNF